MKNLYPANTTNPSHCKPDEYQQMYKQSIENNEAFWQQQAQHRLHWDKAFTQVKDVSFDLDDLHIKWFADGELNACYNCVDRHLDNKADQTAIIWQGDEPSQNQHITYTDLHREVSRFANTLKKLGVVKGDRVTLYMPMIPEAAYAMLACARIGAVHSVVFGGFSPEALAGRIIDCDSKLVITADQAVRGGKAIPLKANVDAAANKPGVKDHLKAVLVVKTSNQETEWHDHDHWYHEASKDVSEDCHCETMNAEDPLFILYTSGSTGQPKGVLHTTGGYLLYAGITHEYVFDYQAGDVYWCTADVGWITGHSYVVYGPLSNGATTLMFEGVPNYPDESRFWQICDQHQVNICYTAPTAIRALMKAGDEAVSKTDRSSLRILGTVGEPINPEAWRWYHEVVGDSRCPIVDTWWQTETGGIMITPLPGATDLKPGSAARPFFGIEPALLDADGNEVLNDSKTGEAKGNLVIKGSWPGQMRTVYGDHQRMKDTYFSAFKGVYTTGDAAKRDADGYYWITGRTDDVLNVSGHRLGTAEVESALVSHPSVAEAAVVGCPHDIKGQAIYAYVSLMDGVSESDDLRNELVQWVRQEIGPIATPEHIQWAPALPKTRSGKIMRRILRKIAANDYQNLGDTSTLAEPAVVKDLINNRQIR
ncbi:acetate--CoA ligase [Marinicella rhabdoformis]|uniref:acetate--CoA ligase n=1 Tax=Marinicella rhabdoformis TaxID=2580566 RepID=UPI0012AEC435|nr:acetate--CoA ligase [Marinicella rhabdoformis]